MKRFVPGKYRPACLMTQTGALSVASPKRHSDHQVHNHMFKTATSSGSQEQIVLQLREIIHRGYATVTFRVLALVLIPRPDKYGSSDTQV